MALRLRAANAPPASFPSFPAPGPGKVLLLCLASFVLHLLYLLSPLDEAGFLPMDEGMYWDLARNLADTGVLALSGDAFATVGAGEPTLFWTPGYPLLLAFLLLTGLPPLPALQVLQSAMAAALPLLLLPWARRLLSGRRLWALLLLAAGYPYYFQLAAQTASEVPAMFLAQACLALALGPSRHGPASLAGLGATAAALALTRPEYLAFALLILGWTWAKESLPRPGGPAGPSRRPALRRAVFSLLFLAAGFLPPMGAWIARNADVTGHPIFTTRAGYSLAYQNEFWHLKSTGAVADEAGWLAALPRAGTELARYRALEARAFAFIRDNPVRYSALCLKRLLSLALPQEAKSLLYRLAGRADVKGRYPPAWYRFSNLVFLACFWLLVLPALARLPRASRSPPFWLSPGGLLLLLVAGQAAVYTFFAYVEYQRSILDFPILLLGLALRGWGKASAEGRVPGEAAGMGAMAGERQ